MNRLTKDNWQAIANHLNLRTFLNFRCISRITARLKLTEHFRPALLTALNEDRRETAKFLLREGVTLDCGSEAFTDFCLLRSDRISPDVELNYLCLTKHAHGYQVKDLLALCLPADYYEGELIPSTVPIQIPNRYGLVNNVDCLDYLIAYDLFKRVTSRDIACFVNEELYTSEEVEEFENYSTGDPQQDVIIIAAMFLRSDLLPSLFRQLPLDQLPIHQLTKLAMTKQNLQLSKVVLEVAERAYKRLRTVSQD